MADSLNLLILPTTPLGEPTDADIHSAFAAADAAPRRLIAVTELELVEALCRQGGISERDGAETARSARRSLPGIDFFSS